MSGDNQADQARADLENALTAISCFQTVLRTLGENDLCFGYLADRLDDHYQDAHDAFSRLFHLDEYGEGRDAQQ